MRAVFPIAVIALALVAGPPPGLAEEVSEAAQAGEKVARFTCGRCHVIGEANRYGGIGSSPSFAAMRNIPDWEDRFRRFYALRPHPAFTQVAGVTPPFDPMRPPMIHPVEITEDELDAIIEFARSIPPKDLGADLNLR